MRKFLNKVISRIRGEPYNIDAQFKPQMILIFLLIRLSMLIRGALRMPGASIGNRIFIGKKAIIRYRGNIIIEGALTLNEYSFVDGVSKDLNRIGKNFSLGSYSKIVCTSVLSELGVGYQIGENVGINSFCYIGSHGGLIIGNDTIIGPYTAIYSENHNTKGPSKKVRLNQSIRNQVEIGANCWLGSGVIVLPGSKIGNNCVIAAGAVVNGIVEDDCLYISREKVIKR